MLVLDTSFDRDSHETDTANGFAKDGRLICDTKLQLQEKSE